MDSHKFYYDVGQISVMIKIPLSWTSSRVSVCVCPKDEFHKFNLNVIINQFTDVNVTFRCILLKPSRTLIFTLSSITVLIVMIRNEGENLFFFLFVLNSWPLTSVCRRWTTTASMTWVKSRSEDQICTFTEMDVTCNSDNLAKCTH